MGFTRNYKNLLTMMLCQPHNYSQADWNKISLVFDDTTVQTVKSKSGTIYKLVIPMAYGMTASDGTVNPASNPQYSIQALDLGHLTGSQKTSLSSSSDVYYKLLRFGTNSNVESIDDYTLSDANITFTQQPKQTGYTSENGKITVYYQCVISSASDITLNELGIYGAAYTQSQYVSGPPNGYSSTYGTLPTILLYRKKLDTPIELKTNIPQLISFSIAVNAPTDDMLNGISTQLDEIIDGGE